MPTLPYAKLLLVSAVAMSLSACGGGSDHDDVVVPPPPPVVVAGDVFVLTASNKLLSFDRATPATIRTTVTVTGLQAGENLLGIDFRPADGQLYGVGSTGRIYTLNGVTGAATVKATLAADAADATAPYTALAGTEFGVDFNPVADRLRIVSNTGQSLRINVDTGATTTDGNINGGAVNTAITAAAYSNSFAGTASTTLFVIDAANATLYTQNPPNNGTLASAVPLGVAATGVAGFDIDARANTGYAVMTVAGVRNLYTLNLAASTAPATLVAAIGVTEELRGIALKAPAAPVAYGLTDDNRIVSFKTATPNTLDANVAVTGLAAGERLLGFDIRPKDGLLYGISSAGRIVTIAPDTGAVTVKATLAADAADASAPYTAIAGAAFGVDFNPVADRLRVIGNTGQSLRINVDTGATTTDGAVNRAGAAPVVTAAAYSNSFAGTTATMLFDIDTASASLALQNPPNDGTLVNVGALGVAVAGDVGFDIAGGANGLALAVLRTSATGPSSLYRIDLATGAAVLSGGAATPAASAIGNGSVGLVDIAIALK
ncbi:DNA polymerase I [Janthinobacterium sp. BJB312]|nr:DNA polymerase I [Janthinobacterium sp. BJB312]